MIKGRGVDIYNVFGEKSLYSINNIEEIEPMLIKILQKEVLQKL